MCTVKTSKTEEISFDGKVLKTPMNSLSEVLNMPSYVIHDSTSVYDAKTQEPLINLVKRGEYLPTELLTFSGSKLNMARLLNVQDLDDNHILVTVLDTIAGQHGETERFIGYLVYKV